jgi:GTP cyclohydrolase IA
VPGSRKNDAERKACGRSCRAAAAGHGRSTNGMGSRRRRLVTASGPARSGGRWSPHGGSFRSSGPGPRGTWRRSSSRGHAAGSPSTADTPRRFVRAIFDATSGYEGDEKLVTAFPTECRGGPDCRISRVVEGRSRSSPCASTTACRFSARHMSATSRMSTSWACPPDEAGAAFVRRLAVHERIGQQLADALERILAPHGIAVHLETVYLCTRIRGVREIESSTRTTYWRSNYDADPQLRGEFSSLCGRRW